MSDARFATVPKIIETPKEGDMDRENLRVLRRLAGRSAQRPGRRPRGVGCALRGTR